MAALKTPEKKTSRRRELRQNIFVDLYARALLFYEEYRSVAQGIGIGLVVLLLAVPGYLYYQQQQQEVANEKLGQILPVYEQQNYQRALEGSGEQAGLVAIARDYGGTEAGNLAAFYAGNALYQQGEYDRALTYFQQFEKERTFIGASAYAAQAAIQENQGNFERAGALYEQAAAQYENKLTAPRYLLSAGQAYEEAGRYEAAMGAYQRIQDEYPESGQANDAERYMARAEVRRDATSS